MSLQEKGSEACRHLHVFVTEASHDLGPGRHKMPLRAVCTPVACSQRQEPPEYPRSTQGPNGRSYLRSVKTGLQACAVHRRYFRDRLL
eukprot:6207293-Pleurochrysis_carterae.AAC.2